MGRSMNEVLSVAVEAAREAGEFLLESQGRVRTVERKGDRSLVSDVDRRSEEMIVRRVRSAFPSHAILGEESGSRPPDPSREEWLWVVDPLDGTHNYLRGIPLFAVSIGVVHRGTFVVGVVNVPTERRLYTAEQGAGACVNGEPIRASARTDLASCSVSLDSDIRADFPRKARAIGALGEAVFNARMFGSSARSLAMVADGTLDAAVEFGDYPWDFAAGVVLVREAGGIITDLAGGEIRCAPSGYLAAGPGLHAKLLAAVSRAL
jgi:myo-inositol-1(or 4)-monophosphatase